MADTPISQLLDADSPSGQDYTLISQRSSTVRIEGTTISALASDQSINDSANGFIAAGFEVGNYVNISGFTGDTANNIVSAEITELTAGKMTFGGADGAVIVDDAAGEPVIVSKWVSRRAPYGGGGSGAALMIAEDYRGPPQSSQAYATKGWMFKAWAEFTIDNVFCDIALVAGATYRARVYRVSGLGAADTISEILDNGVPFVAPANTAFLPKIFPLSAPVTFEPGDNIYVLGLSRTDGGDTYPLPCGMSTTGSAPVKWAPVIGLSTRCQIAFANPIVGNAMAGNASGYGGFGFIFDRDGIVYP